MIDMSKDKTMVPDNGVNALVLHQPSQQMKIMNEFI